MVGLVKAKRKDARQIQKMQVEAFMPLYEIYRDDGSPALEALPVVCAKMEQEGSAYYLIQYDGRSVGAVRVIGLGEARCRIAPLFILPQYQNKGVAQMAMTLVEEMYTDIKVWELDTILQEQGNCYFYEKLGYKRTGWSKTINERMTLIGYEKRI